MLDPKTNMIYM